MIQIKIFNKALFFIFLILPVLLIAQDYELSTKSKKAKKFYESGEEYLRKQQPGLAEKEFLSAVAVDSDFFEAYMLLGEINEQWQSDSNAVFYYNMASQVNPEKFPPVFKIMADIEYENGWYDSAKVHYKKYLKTPAAHGKSRIESEKNLANTIFAIEAIKNPVPFQPANLGPEVNTNSNEYFPCLTADNQTLLFTRLLSDNRSITGRQEDFFISYFGDQSWEQAIDIGAPINTVYNEGAPTLSADGNILIFTACESLEGYGGDRKGYGRCDLFVSKRVGSDWTVPYNIGPPVNSRYWESQPSLSSDGRTLYFVSNRNNNYDIWVTVVDDNGDWSEPRKLGPNINTDGYEGSVFIHPDNQTLYFSSDGHVGMGKLDIFMSRRNSAGEWGKPVNLGYPINSHKDDNSIVISADGALAMFASDREDGFGGLDLYGFELYEEVRPLPVTYMKGVVFDKISGEKLVARFELTDLNTGKVVVESFSNKGNGEFLVSLPTNNDYALTVSREGYLFFSENISLSGENTSLEPFHKDIPLEPLKAGAKIILKNIFFETDKYELKKTSMVELKKMVDLLKNNPAIRVEISGHTDNTGTARYNQELSENRAQAVYEYLISNGIDANRLVFQGYGETRPIDTNETEAGKANNRRTEFMIID
jgi:outer membrane protein OmpA-like peptidoglycan-associated protein